MYQSSLRYVYSIAASKPQQMPDCGSVSLTRRLAVTAGYNSRGPPPPVKGSLLTARPVLLSPKATPPSLPPPLSRCLSLPVIPTFRHSTCHASRNANLIVERILDIAAPFISRRRLHAVETSSTSKVLCTPKLPTRLVGRDRATVMALLKFPLKATRRRAVQHRCAQSSIIESRETRESNRERLWN